LTIGHLYYKLEESRFLMSEKTLFLLKPDALKMNFRVIRAQIDFYKQLKANELSILAKASFTMTYDMLLGYQPVLDPVYQSEMTVEWKDKTLDYQLGPNRDGLKHLLIVVQGYDAISKGLCIKQYLRRKHCPPYNGSPENLIHAPDDNLEYERSMTTFYPIVKDSKLIPNIEFIQNTRREK
jgi:hypothetical protein